MRQVPAPLRSIADRIDRSESPSRSGVVAALRRVLASAEVDAESLAESILEALRDARSRAKAGDDILGEQFPVLSEALWASRQAELILEFPEEPADGGEWTAHLIWLEGGDGEPVGYSAPLSKFSPVKAADVALAHMAA